MKDQKHSSVHALIHATLDPALLFTINADVNIVQKTNNNTVLRQYSFDFAVTLKRSQVL